MENENITPAVEESVVPQVSVEPVKKNNLFKIFVVLVGILIIIGLFANAYLMFSKKEAPVKTPDPLITVTPTPSPTPTPTPDMFTGWKTHTNEVYNFSFQYPQNLVATTPKNYPDITYIDEKIVTIVENSEGPITPISFQIVSGNIASHIADLKKSYQFKNYFEKAMKVSDKDATQFGGIVEAESYIFGNKLIQTVIQLTPEKMLTLEYLDRNPNITEDIYTQILSTFRFD
jgi:hypothetical protein